MYNNSDPISALAEYSVKPFLPFLLCGLHLFTQLAVGSRDLAQAEKKVTVAKAEQS